MEIVYLRGPTSPYLAPASGQPSCHLLKMAHPDLLLELRTTIAQARRCGHAVKKEGLQMHENGGVRMVAIEVTPLQPSLLITEGLLLVLLRETPPAHLPAHLSKGAGSAIFTSLDQADQSSKDERIHQLEQERATLRAETILLVEELEEVNQELQVTSEEIRSSNEELQSINEELETSKEELQLINEELSMTNQELRVRNAQLQAARDYAEAVVETVREPLLVLATDLRISQANRAFYQFFQTTPERTEQRLLFELGNGEWNLPALLSLLKDILPTNHYFHGFEVEQSFPVIGRKILLVNARRILLREQETSLILLACEDITERKAREKQKDDAFIGIASHELKTPLTSLKAYAELLLHRFAQTGDEHAVQLLTKMDRQIDKLISLVQELLDITQMEAGQWNMRRITVDLVALVRESVETLQRMTLTQTIVIEANEKCLIDVDPEGIGRLVTNLLSNAIKYSPIGTTIVVKIAEQSEESNEVTLSVQDFGRGIAPDKHKHLFERFYRVSRSVEETYPGLGLGLYIAAEIVKHHQGRIWVESQEGKGAIFFVTLPKQFRRVNSEGERAEEDAYLTENERARMVHGQERRSDGSKNTGG